MKSPKDILGRVSDALPSIEWPTLGRAVDIPVYMIHNSRDSEDYFFIFDFEEFVERSRGGVFVRPQIKLWAGRDDFSRRQFSRQFREAFAREFDAARGALQAEQSKKGGFGWLGWDLGFNVVSSLVTSLIANVVLLLAVTTGRAVLKALPFGHLLRGKGDDAKLEDEIAKTQGKVDEALERLQVVLHMELYRHAWRGGDAGPMGGVDYDAWPLPAHVVEHLGDGESGSWW